MFMQGELCGAFHGQEISVVDNNGLKKITRGTIHTHEGKAMQRVGNVITKRVNLRDPPDTMHVHEGGDMQRLGHLMAKGVEAECDCFTPGGVGHHCQACRELPLSIMAVVHADGVLDVACCCRVGQHSHPACAQRL